MLSQAPEAATVFASDQYGSNGDANDNCVKDGQFAQWKPYYPKPHCLQRNFKYKTNLGAFHSFESINKIVTMSKDYMDFRSQLEMLAHPTPHVNIGGDMAEMHSPNDPVFWLHHCYIDYIWAQWQKLKGKQFAGVNNSGKPVQKSDIALGLGSKYEHLLDQAELCYDYADLTNEDLGESKIPPSTVKKPEAGKRPDMVDIQKMPTNDDERLAASDRSNMNILRVPDQAAEEFCRKNNYDLNKVRTFEKDQKQLFVDLNKIDGFVSPCSLWKRPSLSAKLISQRKPLFVDVKNVGRINVGYDKDTDPMQAYSNVKERAKLCSPNVELPPEKYQSQVEKLVGRAAFDGAGTGSLKKIKSEDDVSGAQLHSGHLYAASTVAIVLLVEGLAMA